LRYAERLAQQARRHAAALGQPAHFHEHADGVVCTARDLRMFPSM
jgi:hypothetical protein